MFALVSWLLGGGVVPGDTLVWASDGLAIAVTAAVLLLLSAAILVAVRERPSEAGVRRIRPQAPSMTTKSDARLPSAA